MLRHPRKQKRVRSTRLSGQRAGNRKIHFSQPILRRCDQIELKRFSCVQSRAHLNNFWVLRLAKARLEHFGGITGAPKLAQDLHMCKNAAPRLHDGARLRRAKQSVRALKIADMRQSQSLVIEPKGPRSVTIRDFAKLGQSRCHIALAHKRPSLKKPVDKLAHQTPLIGTLDQRSIVTRRAFKGRKRHLSDLALVAVGL